MLKRTPVASDHSKLLLEFSREFAGTEGWVLNRFEIVDDRRDVVRIEREDWHIGMAGNDALGDNVAGALTAAPDAGWAAAAAGRRR